MPKVARNKTNNLYLKIGAFKKISVWALKGIKPIIWQYKEYHYALWDVIANQSENFSFL